MSQLAQTVNEEIWEKIFDLTEGAMNPCFQCGTCTAVCPWGKVRKQPYNVRRMVRAAQLGLDGASQDIWLCASCKLCESRCPRGVQIVDTIYGLRSLALEQRKAPPKLEEVLWGIYENGNSAGGNSAERSRWADGLEVKNATKGVKALLYIGCAASFDRRLQKVARALVKIFSAARLDFGVLGNEEKCCGDAVRAIGEKGFLQELIESNIAAFNRTRAEIIVALSPHCSNMFKNVYPKYGAKFRAVHYTEIIEELLDGGQLKVAGKTSTEVTYHDPCYLGRYNGTYEAPRKILESIGRVKFVEMKNNKANALCCGGGGGRIWLETAPAERFSDLRVEEAVGSQSKILATSCPYCIQNFEDSIKTRQISELQVKDVAELLSSALE